MKTQVKTVFSCKAFLQKRRLSLVLFPKVNGLPTVTTKDKHLHETRKAQISDTEFNNVDISNVQVYFEYSRWSRVFSSIPLLVERGCL